MATLREHHIDYDLEDTVTKKITTASYKRRYRLKRNAALRSHQWTQGFLHQYASIFTGAVSICTATDKLKGENIKPAEQFLVDAGCHAMRSGCEDQETEISRNTQENKEEPTIRHGYLQPHCNDNLYDDEPKGNHGDENGDTHLQPHSNENLHLNLIAHLAEENHSKDEREDERLKPHSSDEPEEIHADEAYRHDGPSEDHDDERGDMRLKPRNNGDESGDTHLKLHSNANLHLNLTAHLAEENHSNDEREDERLKHLQPRSSDELKEIHADEAYHHDGTNEHNNDEHGNTHLKPHGNDNMHLDLTAHLVEESHQNDEHKENHGHAYIQAANAEGAGALVERHRGHRGGTRRRRENKGEIDPEDIHDEEHHHNDDDDPNLKPHSTDNWHPDLTAHPAEGNHKY